MCDHKLCGLEWLNLCYGHVLNPTPIVYKIEPSYINKYNEFQLWLNYFLWQKVMGIFVGSFFFFSFFFFFRFLYGHKPTDIKGSACVEPQSNLGPPRIGILVQTHVGFDILRYKIHEEQYMWWDNHHHSNGPTPPSIYIHAYSFFGSKPVIQLMDHQQRWRKYLHLVRL